MKYLARFDRIDEFDSETVKMRHGVPCLITIFTNLYYAFAIGDWIPYRTSRDLALDFETRTETTQTQPLDNNAVINATQNRSDADQFWLLRDENTTEEVATIQSDSIMTESVTEHIPQEERTESTKPIQQDDPEWAKEYKMNELIFLSRNNCNLELQINEWEDRKLKIQYEKLKTGMSGRCQINLTGKNGIFLAVLVSNVQLNGKTARQMTAEPTEVLKLVTRSHHFDYTLREYHGNEEYYPVILTDSDRVNLILLFNGTHPTATRSSYNLEVFNYYKNYNKTNKTTLQDDHHGYGNSSRYVDNIFITTTVP